MEPGSPSQKPYIFHLVFFFAFCWFLNSFRFFHFHVHARLEQVNIKRRDGLAKVLGTIACIGGATIITLYKGPPLLHHQSQDLLGDAAEGSTMLFSSKMGNWRLGCLYLLGNCFAWSGWIVLQVSHHYNELISWQDNTLQEH